MESKKIKRRDFLRLSAAAAVGLGVSKLRPFATLAQIGQGEPDTASAHALRSPAAQNEWIATCCNMCGGTTGILAHVVNGRVVKIEPNSANPVGVANISTDYYNLKSTGARMCPKGNAGIMSLYDPDRVKKPLKRVGARGAGQWQEISYEQAVTEIAAKLADIATQATEQGYIIHRLSCEGETLFAISRWYSGDPNNWRKIKDFNEDLDPNTLRIGDEIRIPLYLGLTTREPMECPGSTKRRGEPKKREKKGSEGMEPVGPM